MRLLIKIILLLLFLIATNHAIAQIKILEDSELGSFNIGFKHETVTDYSRSFGNTFRPVELFIWYPSNEKDTTTINYTDYLMVKNEYRDSNQISKSQRLDSLLQKAIDRSGLTENNELLLENYKNLKTSAVKNINIAPGLYPLIVFGSGGTTPGYLYSAMCENLASYGYVVVCLSALGIDEKSRWPFDQSGIDLQIEDMSFAINQLKRTINQIEINKICLISWSVGGVAQTIYAMKNSGIDLLISLDSGIGRTYGIEMIKESPHFDYQKLNLPYMHFTGTQPERFVVEKTSELYDSIPSLNKYSLIIKPFAHEHFTFQNGMINDLISETEDKTISNAYLKMCYTTRIFIDAFLKEDSDALTKLSILINK